jgi:DNA repair protein RecO (recombination protein O)
MRHTESAICLRTTDYSETSQVVHFLTRETGVVNLIAKGTKRPKSKSGGPIDLLAEGELVFSTKASGALGILMEFSETVSRATLRKNAPALNTALYMIELVGDMLAEADPYPGVFDLLHKAIGRLGEDDAPVGAVLAYFQWRLLRHAGLLGGLTTCAGCGMDVSEMPHQAEAYFSSQHGGILCDGCEGATREKFRLEQVTLQGLSVLAAAEAGQRVTLPQAQARAVNRLLAYHITQQLGKTLRMARYVIPRK